MGTYQGLMEAYGANYRETMGRFMGNEAMYLRILSMLFQDDNLKKLGDGVAAEDWSAAFEAAHALKGVAGNLGLTPLYQAVSAMVEPLRKGEVQDYAQLYQRVEREFSRAGELCEQLKGENPR